MRSLPPGKVVTDVTERSRAQTLSIERRVRRLEADVRAKNAKIAALEERLRGELDSETANIAIIDECGRIVDVNAAWKRFYASNGGVDDRTVGMDYIACEPASSLAALASSAKRAIEDVLSGRRERAALTYPCDSPSQKRWFEMTVAPVGKGARRGAIVRHTNVTEDARAQSELRRQTDFVRSIDAALHVLLYERVADGERWTYGFSTERFTQTFGRPPEAAQTSTTDWLMGLLDPADRDRVSASYRAVLKAGGGLWRSEFRAKTSSGSFTWFHMVANFEVRDGREVRSVGMLQDISIEKAESELADYARDYDELTGIFSRSYFERAASKALEHWMTTGKFFAIVIVDIDDFHEINKVYGVDAGGALRRELAQSLAGMMRASDLIARFGENQIGIIADVRDGDEARAFAHKLVESLRADFRFAGNFVGLSVSAGVSLPRGGGATATDLFHDARVALYGALAAGGGTEIVYSSGMGAEYVARVTLKAELREALAQAQFELYYQPKIDLESGSVIGCEALLRWNHPTLGLQAPGIFIPVAEQSGLIVPLGEWVVFEACRQSVRWRDAGLSPVPIAINLSPVQFHRSDVFEMLSNAFATTGASPGALDVEVTESVFINFSDDLVATLEKIRALGIEISLDDFGTGFSSLAYLTRLPLSIIKIDQTFVRGASENPSDAAIVRWVAQLAEELSLRVVAEGVETQEQLDFVRRAGCAEAQGYFFSRPVPAASFANLLKPAALVSASV